METVSVSMHVVIELHTENRKQVMELKLHKKIDTQICTQFYTKHLKLISPTPRAESIIYFNLHLKAKRSQLII